MSLYSVLIGRPLPKSSAGQERLPRLEALPILSSDALSSVAYATEAALGVLILAGSRALSLSLPITLAIIALITVVVLSYRQVIAAYPDGGGSNVVARDNLGRNVGLVAAAALLIDYVLTAAVSLMAGGQAISSLLPSLLPHEVALSLLLLALVGWANLRGLREAGRLFAVPTYAFVVMLALLTLLGLHDLVFHHGFRPDPPPSVTALEPLGLFLILRAFSSGCSAMTGIEAIANGVQVFREPAPAHARQTLLVMGVLLSLMFFSVSGMGFLYGIAPDPPHHRAGPDRHPGVWSRECPALGTADFNLADLGAGGEHRLLWIPSAGGDAGQRSLPAASDGLAWRPACVSERHRRAAGIHGRDHLDLSGRHHRGGESLCPGGVHGLHPVAAWPGAALVAPAGPGLAGTDGDGR